MGTVLYVEDHPPAQMLMQAIVGEMTPHQLQVAGSGAQARTMAGVASVQITFHEDKLPARHAMPPGGFRLAIVNAWSRPAGLAARELLRTSLACSRA